LIKFIVVDFGLFEFGEKWRKLERNPQIREKIQDQFASYPSKRCLITMIYRNVELN
jgi:hypothetical protein